MSTVDRSRLAALLEGRLSRRAALRATGGVAAATALAAVARPSGVAAEESAATAASFGSLPYFQTQQGDSAGGMEFALSQLDAIVADIQTRSGVPGIAVSVVSQDEVVFVKGFGVREVGTTQLVGPDTVFELASLSKPVGSTAIARVVGDGHVSWHSRISDLMPWFEMNEPWVTREIMLADMYSHRSGWPDHAGDYLEDIGYDRYEILHRLRYQRPDSSFRTGYAYTNYGITAAAEAVAEFLGTTWEELSQQQLYGPLGMTSTSSNFEDFINNPSRAHGHWEFDGGWTVAPVRDPQQQSPAGGVYSSVRDMAEWMRLQLAGGAYNGEQIVAAEALAETHRPQMRRNNGPGTPESDRNGFYGLGWNVSYDDHGRTRLSHSGAFFLGAATAVYMIPAEQFGITVLTNGWPIGAAESIALSFEDLVLFGAVQVDYFAEIEPIFRAMMTPPYASDVDLTSPPANAEPPLAAEAYTGVYLDDLHGPIEVAEEDGLVLRLGPEPMTFGLTHYDRDVFWYTPPGENGGYPSAVTFTVGEDGIATKVTVANFDVYHQGTFYRPAEEAGE